MNVIGVTSRKFPKKLSYIMKKKKITIDSLAEKMGENPIYIMLLKKGKRCSIQLQTLINFSDALHVPLSFFCDCIREDIVDNNPGVTNRKFTKLLNAELSRKKISHRRFAKLMNIEQNEAAEYMLGIKYKLDIPTLLKVVSVLHVADNYFWDCIEFN